MPPHLAGQAALYAASSCHVHGHEGTPVAPMHQHGGCGPNVRPIMTVVAVRGEPCCLAFSPLSANDLCWGCPARLTVRNLGDAGTPVAPMHQHGGCGPNVRPHHDSGGGPRRDVPRSPY